MNRKDLLKLFKTAAKNWLKNNASLRAAALTFFIILPMPPLLLIVQTIFSFLFGKEGATQQLIQQIAAVAGPVVADLFKELLVSQTSPFTSITASITVVGFSIVGVIGAFAVLRDSLNVIWKVNPPVKKSLPARIKHSIGPFVVVAGLGLIIIAAEVVATTLIRAITLYSINDALTAIAVTIAPILLSFGLSTLLFAIVYKVLPEAKIQWRDVIIAALTTGILFTIINYFLGTYIQTFPITTIIGAAGALMILLIWTYILNQIILFGGEISKVYATEFGTEENKEEPEAIKKATEPLAKTGEKVEEATKGAEIPPKRKREQNQGNESAQAPTPPPKASLKEEPPSLPSNKTPIETIPHVTPPIPQEESSLEVNLTLKTPKKKQKSRAGKRK